MGSVWFDTLVASYANVYLLRPRISFIPGEPYNKDCMLAHFVSPSDEERRIDRDPGFPFTIERWRKCCSIRDGISALGKILSELLGKEDDSAAKLDSIQPRLQLSLSGLMEEEKIQGGKKQ